MSGQGSFRACGGVQARLGKGVPAQSNGSVGMLQGHSHECGLHKLDSARMWLAGDSERRWSASVTVTQEGRTADGAGPPCSTLRYMKRLEQVLSPLWQTTRNPADSQGARSPKIGLSRVSHGENRAPNNGQGIRSNTVIGRSGLAPEGDARFKKCLQMLLHLRKSAKRPNPPQISARILMGCFSGSDVESLVKEEGGARATWCRPRASHTAPGCKQGPARHKRPGGRRRWRSLAVQGSCRGS